MSGVTCEAARNLFDAYLNGELTAALETELNAHRLRCAGCRHELALLEVAGAVVAADDRAPTLDDEFTSRLMTCVAEQQTPRRLRRRRLVRIGTRVLAAAACLVLIVGYFVNRPQKEVAGWRSSKPHPLKNPERVEPAEAAEFGSESAPPEATLQSQVERALTDWRRDASSLKEVYRIINPPVRETQGLERRENTHDEPEPIEPGRPDTEDQGPETP